MQEFNCIRRVAKIVLNKFCYFKVFYTKNVYVTLALILVKFNLFINLCFNLKKTLSFYLNFEL